MLGITWRIFMEAVTTVTTVVNRLSYFSSFYLRSNSDLGILWALPWNGSGMVLESTDEDRPVKAVLLRLSLADPIEHFSGALGLRGHQGLKFPAGLAGNLKLAITGSVGRRTIATDLIGEEIAPPLTGLDGVEVEKNPFSCGCRSLIFLTGFVFASDRSRKASTKSKCAEDD
jgi:hypothetical protein